MQPRLLSVRNLRRQSGNCNCRVISAGHRQSPEVPEGTFRDCKRSPRIPENPGFGSLPVQKTLGTVKANRSVCPKTVPSASILLFQPGYPAIYLHAASAATAPSAAAVVSWRTSFVRQSPAAKIPGADVTQSSAASINPF